MDFVSAELKKAESRSQELEQGVTISRNLAADLYLAVFDDDVVLAAKANTALRECAECKIQLKAALEQQD